MKKIICILLLSGWCTGSLFSQKLTTFKGWCGIYYKTLADLKKQKAAELSFYHFAPGQTVASIGAQCTHWEAAFAAATDNVTFYLQDIDSSYMNKRQADFTWNYYAGLLGRPLSNPYHLVIGNEKSTNLPDALFDKIIIINTFHEFTYPAEMLADISQKLKPGGMLYIDEALPKKPGQLHGVCKKRMYTADELINYLSQHGYNYAGSLDLNFRKGKPRRKIFSFTLKQ